MFQNDRVELIVSVFLAVSFVLVFGVLRADYVNKQIDQEALKIGIALKNK